MKKMSKNDYCKCKKTKKTFNILRFCKTFCSKLDKKLFLWDKTFLYTELTPEENSHTKVESSKNTST